MDYRLFYGCSDEYKLSIHLKSVGFRYQLVYKVSSLFLITLKYRKISSPFHSRATTLNGIDCFISGLLKMCHLHRRKYKLH